LGKRGVQPHPSLSSAKSLLALLRKHCWCVPEAAASLGVTKSAVYLALKTYGVTIPAKQAARIRRESARHAANARWGKA
jgi:hypothetical protein